MEIIETAVDYTVITDRLDTIITLLNNLIQLHLFIIGAVSAVAVLVILYNVALKPFLR